MSQQQDDSTGGDGEGAHKGVAQQQQQQQPQPVGRGGQGAESAMEHLREWEQRRSGNTGGMRGH